MNAYSVHDSAAEAYLEPFYARTDAEAVRRFASAASKEDHQFHQHGGDFTLFRVGEWDEKAGRLVPAEVNKNLGNALMHRKTFDMVGEHFPTEANKEQNR